MLRPDLHEANRHSWNAATLAHNSHKRDQARFLREGGHSLYPEELVLLGDVRDQTLVHLQCNSGQDTLSLAQFGAAATGVDISDEAIAFARRLSLDSGLPATFIRADVYNWLEDAKKQELQFDTAFSSYGAICWLSNLDLWARGIREILKPGGIFVLMEFHPVMQMLSDTGYRIEAPYGGGGMLRVEEGIHDYVAQSGPSLTPSGYLEGVSNFTNPNPCHEFNWGIGDLLGSLIEAGLMIERFAEYPYSNGFKPFPAMVENPAGKFTLPAEMPPIPLMFGVRAKRI